MIKKLFRTAVYLLATGLMVSLILLHLAAAPAIEDDRRPRDPGESGDGKIDPAAAAPAFKDETVYVVLDHTGKVKDQRIVNRVYGSADPGAALVVDYGCYLEITGMNTPAEPLIEDNRILWDSALLEEGDLYYEGLTDKPLPLEFTVTYRLDGKEIDPGELPGQSGRLEIKIAARNNLAVEGPVYYEDYHGNTVARRDLNYVPLLVQGSYSVDLNKFRNVEAPGAATVVIGQSKEINFMIFPYPEAQFAFSMEGEEIELRNIMLVVIPKLPPLPAVDMEEDLAALLEGVSVIGAGLQELYDGADQVLRGLELFRDESNRMLKEAATMAELVEQLKSFIEEAASRLDAIDPNQLAETIDYILALLEELPEPDPAAVNAVFGQADALLRHAQELNEDIASLEATNHLVIAEAQKLVQENEAGSPLHQLGLLLLARAEQVERVSSGGNALGQEIASLRDRAAGLESGPEERLLREWRRLRETMPAYRDRQDELKQNLANLAGFLRRLDHLTAETRDLLAAAGEMFEQMTMLPEALAQLAAGQRQIRDGLGELHDRGIKELEKGLMDGFNEARYGAAKMKLMESLAENYRSHADNENNRYSSVQFILMVEELKKQESDLIKDNENNEKGEAGALIRLWDKFLGLFRDFNR